MPFFLLVFLGFFFCAAFVVLFLCEVLSEIQDYFFPPKGKNK